MQPISRVEIRNFKCHEFIQWSLDEGITVVVAPNGKGKSSFEQAIAWCLYGSPAVPCNQEELIREGADECYTSVDVSFGNSDEYFTFERKYSSRDGLTARVYSYGEIVADKSSGVAEFLKDRGIDLEGFNLVRAEQGELAFFVHATPAIRKSLISSLVQVDSLDDVISTVRSVKKEMALEIENLPTEEDIKILEAHINHYQAEMDKYLSEKAEEENKAEELKGELEAAAEAVKTLPVIHSLDKKKEALLAAIASLQREKESILSKLPQESAVPEEELEVLRYSVSDLLDKFYSVENTWHNLRSEVIVLSGKLESIKDGKCPTCGIEGDILDNLVEETQSSLEATNKFWEASEFEKDDLEEKLKEAQAALEAAHERNSAYEEWAESGAQGKIEVIDEKITEYQERVKDIVFEIEGYPEVDVNLIQKTQNDLLSVQDDISYLAKEARKWEYNRDQYLEKLNDALQTIQELKGLIGKEENLDKLSRTLPVFRDLTLSQSLDWVAERASVLLSAAWEDTHEITIDTDLGFWLDNRKLSNYSSGQVDLVCVCIRIALSEYLSSRIGFSGLLILDGVFDRIDEDNRDSIGRLLSSINLRQVIVLSHFDVPVIGGREIRIR